jgi:hypothetical protein
VPLTKQVIAFAVLRAVALAITVAIAFGQPTESCPPGPRNSTVKTSRPGNEANG